VKGKPIVVATWPGTEPALPAVLLNGHYDVVPVFAVQWTEAAPFSGALVRDEAADDDRIYGRGAQDKKCVVVQYLVALSRLAAAGFAPRRTVALSFVPDEEIGGADGMGALLRSDAWRALNVGVALDEGLANPTPGRVTVFYGERTPWWVLVSAKGPTGHGSRFINPAATAKLVAVAQRALAYRAEQERALGYGYGTAGGGGSGNGGSDGDGACGCAKHAQAKKLGDVTTVNLTMLKAGVSADGGKTWALNVSPTEAEGGFDIRVSPSVSPAEMKALIDEWCAEEGVSWRYAPWTARRDSAEDFLSIESTALHSHGLDSHSRVYTGIALRFHDRSRSLSTT